MLIFRFSNHYKQEMFFRSRAFFLILFILLSVSCQKMNETEIELGRFKINNTILLEALDNRLQVIEFSYNTNACAITFSNGHVSHFSGKTNPLLTIGENNCWWIGDKKTNIPVEFNEEGNPVTPVLSVADSGVWAIDGAPTTCSADSYISLANEPYLPKRHLVGIICFPEKCILILSDRSSYCLSVIEDEIYLVPSFYIEHLIEKEVLSEKYIAQSNNNCSSFVFFSDSHWNNNFQHSPALIRHIREYSGIDKVIFGGDVIYNRETDPSIALKEGLEFQRAFSFLGPNFYCVYGNHDDNSDFQEKVLENHLTKEQVVSFLQSQMTNLGRKEGYNFYFDEITSKTRYIGLDTGRFYRNNSNVDAVPTVLFLIDALQTVPEGWHIIVISHIFMETKTVEGEKVCYIPNFYKFPLQIMDNYNQRNTGYYSYNKEKLFYDFTDCLGHVEFCMGGHIHIEGLLYTETGIPIICVPTDSKSINSQAYKKGTITEQSVSIVVVDYSSQKMNLVSIGRGTDRAIDLR